MNLAGIPKYIGHRLRHRLSLKLVALGLALLIFFVAEAERQAKSESNKTEHATMVSLVISDIPPGLSLSEAPATVEVRARGPMGEALPGTVRASVSLAGRAPGECSVPVSVNLPKGWTLTEVRPQVLNLKLEAMLSRAFLATLVTPGGNSPGISDYPVQCTVQGPSSRVKQVRAVIAMISADSRGPVDVRLVPVDRDGQPVTRVGVFPEWVRLILPIQGG